MGVIIYLELHHSIFASTNLNNRNMIDSQLYHQLFDQTQLRFLLVLPVGHTASEVKVKLDAFYRYFRRHFFAAFGDMRWVMSGV